MSTSYNALVGSDGQQGREPREAKLTEKGEDYFKNQKDIHIENSNQRVKFSVSVLSTLSHYQSPSAYWKILKEHCKVHFSVTTLVLMTILISFHVLGILIQRKNWRTTGPS